MTVKSVDKTLCVLPLRLFTEGEPTVFQDGDQMFYDHTTKCLGFTRRGIPLICGNPGESEDDKIYLPLVNDYSFGTFGRILSLLFGFKPTAAEEKRGNLWLWNFCS